MKSEAKTVTNEFCIAIAREDSKQYLQCFKWACLHETATVLCEIVFLEPSNSYFGCPRPAFCAEPTFSLNACKGLVAQCDFKNVEKMTGQATDRATLAEKIAPESVSSTT